VAFDCGSTPLPAVETTPDTSNPWQIRWPRPLMQQELRGAAATDETPDSDRVRRSCTAASPREGAAPRKTRRPPISPGQACNSFRNALTRDCGNFTTILIFPWCSTRETVSFNYRAVAAACRSFLSRPSAMSSYVEAQTPTTSPLDSLDPDPLTPINSGNTFPGQRECVARCGRARRS
jgi:hypothetical protein